MESRRLLAAVNWTGLGDGVNWTNAANWSSNPALPGSGDDVTINVAANPNIVLTSGTQTIKSLSNAESLAINGGTLAVTTAASSSTNISIGGGTISGGAWTLSSGANFVATTSGGTLSSVAIAGDILLNTSSSRVLLAGTTSFTTARMSAGSTSIGMVPGYTLSGTIVDEGATGGNRVIEMNGAAGTFTVGAAGTIRLASGAGGDMIIGGVQFFGGTMSLVNNGLITAEAAGRTMTIQGGGALTNNGTTQVTAGTLNITAPTVTISGTTLVTGAGLLNVDNAGGVVTITPTGNATVTRFRVSSLTINGTATSAVNGAQTAASSVANLTFGASGKWDLNDNDLVIDYPVAGPSPIASVLAAIAAGRNGGAWNGASTFASTSARNATPKNRTLAALESLEYRSVAGVNANFDGIAIDNSAVLVKFTYYGDTDFNGVVNFDDYSRTDAGFNLGRTGWLNGDFDGNGIVNFDDYSLIDLAFYSQTVALRDRSGAPRFTLGSNNRG